MGAVDQDLLVLVDEGLVVRLVHDEGVVPADHAEIGADYIAIAVSRLDADKWPSFRDLCISLQAWREQRKRLQRAWLELSAEQQAQVDRPPEMDSSDPTCAWL